MTKPPPPPLVLLMMLATAASPASARSLRRERMAFLPAKALAPPLSSAVDEKVRARSKSANHDVAATCDCDHRFSPSRPTTTTTRPTPPRATAAVGATPPGKADLYDDGELFDLLNLHRALNPEGGDGSTRPDPDVAPARGGPGDPIDEESIAGGIHELVLRALEGDGATTAAANDGSATAQEGGGIPGLHKLVLETIEEIDGASSCTGEASGDDDDDVDGYTSRDVNNLAYDNLQTLLRDKKPFIRAIATDVDGTLLSGQYLHPTTRDAILRAIDQAYNIGGDNDDGDDDDDTPSRKIRHFFPATGKSRRGAAMSLGPTVGPLLYELPGVYIQGLYCVDASGGVVFERRLPTSAVRAAEELAAECGASVVGYDGDDLYCAGEPTDVVVSLSEVYGEPPVRRLTTDEDDAAEEDEAGARTTAAPSSTSRGLKLAEHAPGVHKLLIMDDDPTKLSDVVRPKLERLALRVDATVTQALPTMLELLPAGCSKGDGVARLCSALGVNAGGELLALGDAENDVEMLEMASIGVAVGNACRRARDAADFVMRESHEEGGAGLAMNLFGFDA